MRKGCRGKRRERRSDAAVWRGRRGHASHSARRAEEKRRAKAVGAARGRQARLPITRGAPEDEHGPGGGGGHKLELLEEEAAREDGEDDVVRLHERDDKDRVVLAQRRVESAEPRRHAHEEHGKRHVEEPVGEHGAVVAVEEYCHHLACREGRWRGAREGGRGGRRGRRGRVGRGAAAHPWSWRRRRRRSRRSRWRRRR